MIKRINIIIAGITLMLCLASAVAQSNPGASAITTLGVADGQAACCAKAAAVTDSYDPLIPQLFAVDTKTNVLAAINTVDNTVDILVRNTKGDSLLKKVAYRADKTYKRHDIKFIYRPQSVAVYAGHIVVLAANNDSSFLAVLDLEGNEVNKLKFPGCANAFSYSNEAKTLYAAGNNKFGYDFIILDAANGLDKLTTKDVAVRHYVKPKMSEVIAVKDPHGIGLTVIAMVVVFFALMILYLIFKQLGASMMARLKKKEGKQEEKTGIPASTASGDTHGAVYAAIAAAIYLYDEELHDEEATVLTINKVSRAYSPWSSKIHGLNTYFNNKR